VSTSIPPLDLPAGRAWDEAALGWSQHGSTIRQWLLDATTAMLDAAQIQPGDRILDVAAGAGDQTLDVARRVGPGGSVLATDLSPRILELAAENLRAAGMPQVRTLQADAEALGLAGADFDAAVCRLGLMLCPAPAKALQEIHSALATGGRLSALVFSTPQANPCISILMRTATRHAGSAPKDPCTPGALLSLGSPGLLERLLQQAGFIDIQVRALAAPFRMERCEDYVAFVRSAASPVIEMLKPLSAQAREAAWADITEQLRAFDTPKGWEGPNELLLCSAQKPG
jgi:ubiquinone/menaquinone biosynthesis C-methylase UbiE